MSNIENLGKKIFNAVQDSCARNLNFRVLMNPNEKFSLTNPYILEALSDAPKEVIEAAKALEGKPISDACKAMDNPSLRCLPGLLQKTNKKSDVVSKARLLYKNGLLKAARVAKINGSETELVKARGLERFVQSSTIDKLSPKELYYNYIDHIYREMRIADYGVQFIKSQNIAEVTAKPSSLIRVVEQNGWHYRLPRNVISAKSVDRVSLNVVADNELIADLDRLFATGELKGYYKTPDDVGSWLSRHDPVTIYLDKKATPQDLQKISKTCSKYIRSKEPLLAGSVFADGMALQASPTETDILDLLNKMRKIDLDLEAAFKDYLVVRDGKYVASAGQFSAAQKALNDLIN